MRSWETGWLSGVYDGEGWLSTRKGTRRSGYGDGWYIGFAQNDGEVLELAKRLTKERGYATRDKNSRQRAQKFVITGAYDCFRFLGECRPVRLIEKSRPWLEGCTFTRSKGTARNQRYSLEVAEVEFLGDQEIIALSTSTQTVIAEGMFASLAPKSPNRVRIKSKRR